MAFGILVLITALTISAVAIYYSVAGLVAIFAAAAIPIMIMGGALEIAKLVTAVWLHRYWKQSVWWLRTYLAVAVVVLMLITSMGIFGFLSKAHIEQTTASQESVAQVERLATEISRQNAIVARAEERIKSLETSGTGADANIQSQIDKEQERIDKAFERIQPAIEQQNKIIADARDADGNRTKPYEDQLTSIQSEILRLETSAREYEDKIAGLGANTSAVEPLLAQIRKLEEEIIRVTNQLQSKEQSQIRAGQAIIGVTSDGLFGGNTRTALATWVSGQRTRITQIQGEISQLRKDATGTVNAERTRLANVVKDIRTKQIPALKDRELTMLGKIDEVRRTESPAIKTARDEIQRLRESAEAQMANSQTLIQRLRGQLAQTDKADEIDSAVDELNARIKQANTEIDTLTEEKYKLEGEYRKLEAEVGPIKYIAEFIYGDTADTNMLEHAVRWVIIIIIFVFDPLAVLLLIASQYTFDFYRNRPQEPKEEEPPHDPDSSPGNDSIFQGSSAESESSESTVRSEETKTDSGTESKDSGTEKDSVQSVVKQEEKLDEEVKQEEAPDQDATTSQEDVETVGIEEEQKSPSNQEQDNSTDSGIQQKLEPIIPELEEEIKKKDETPVIREYESVTGERIKIKADILGKPKTKEKKPTSTVLNAPDLDPMQKVYNKMVNDVSEKEQLENNTTWLPLQKK